MKYLLPTLLTIILTLNNMLIVKAQDKSTLYVSLQAMMLIMAPTNRPYEQ